MQVACNQCGATYEFDSAAIPAAGYDAQCTGCGGVFFVKPEAPPDEQISVACGHCGAVYQFPASAIPTGGYDAQCTQCQQVFFVSGGGAAAPATPDAQQPAPTEPEAAPEDVTAVEPVVLDTPKTDPGAQPRVGDGPTGPTPQAAPAEPLAVPSSEPLAVPSSEPLAVPSSEPLAVPFTEPLAVPSTEPLAAASDEPLAAEPPVPVPEAADADVGTSDLMELSAELGDPAPTPDGVSLEDDFEQIMARKRKRLMVIGAVITTVVAYIAISYLAVPRLFDMTVGKIVGIKLTVHPDAVPYVGTALERIYADTDAAYTDADNQLSAALEIDAAYPEAMALLGLARAFRGSDVQARGREIYAAGAKAVAEAKALEELPAKQRPKDFEERVAQLRATAQRSSDESTALFEAGGKEVSAGYMLLTQALEIAQEDPFIAEASGIYYTTDSDSIYKAQELLRYAVEVRYGPGNTLDLANSPNVWLPFLQGLVRARARDGGADARAAFETCLELTPGFQRARYELAELLHVAGKTDEARALASEILAAVPAHDKAARFLARTATVATAPEATPTPPKPTKGKKRKGKRRR